MMNPLCVICCFSLAAFNLFLVSELSMICVSLLHYDFVSITSCITYILSVL